MMRRVRFRLACVLSLAATAPPALVAPAATKLRANPGDWKGATPAAEGVAAGAASPSAPVVSACRRQSGCQRVFARQDPECDRYLPSPRDAELLSKRVTVGFRGSRRDAERDADLLVRHALRDQFDDLPLPRGDAGRISECLHDGRVGSRAPSRYRPKGVSQKPPALAGDRVVDERVDERARERDRVADQLLVGERRRLVR
jgi:hypothetical protein